MTNKTAFIGLGNMGLPMALNLQKDGLAVTGFDLSEVAKGAASRAGLPLTEGLEQAVDGVATVITMLPMGEHVLSVYETVLPRLRPGALLIDCSTIDVASARKAHGMAGDAGLLSVDAPVSGGVMGAQNGTLTFMAGGSGESLDAAEPILGPMAGRVVRCGEGGAGQAAKACNNMILAITMIGTSEAFALGKKLGLDDQALFDVVSTASGQSWSTTTYCPVPGPVPTSPANNDYKPGFAVDLMLKDLNLAAQAAAENNAETPLGSHALEIYKAFADDGQGGLDFSGIIKKFRDDL